MWGEGGVPPPTSPPSLVTTLRVVTTPSSTLRVVRSEGSGVEVPYHAAERRNPITGLPDRF
ncbi:hypothetical protein JCM17961_41980 [Endothiovibrio diazotrophicus]